MRDLAPADLRYQFLQAGPGRTPWVVGGIAGGVGVGGAVAAAIATGIPQLLFLTPLLALAVRGVLGKVSRLRSSKDLRTAEVGIVPWGIVIDPDGEPIVVPWSAIREVTYTLVKRDQNQYPEATAFAIMVFDTEQGRVQAAGDDGEWVTSVDSFHRRLARAADRPPAGDLAGTEPLHSDGLPSSLALLRRAEAILDSAEGRLPLALEAGGYRTTSSRLVGPETRGVLRDALWNGNARFDPGPLAAVLIAHLQVAALLPDVLRLILSPSPLLAAVARAAAIRLGASRMAAGALDEVKLFVPDSELRELQNWIDHV